MENISFQINFMVDIIMLKKQVNDYLKINVGLLEFLELLVNLGLPQDQKPLERRL